MRDVELGRTGLTVSAVCLGTMTFGYQCDEALSRRILDEATALGIRFLDTADVYPLGGGAEHVGRSEEILGRCLAGRRDEFVVATKFGSPAPGQQGHGAGRKHIRASIERSLRRLRTDRVDLYQLHVPDRTTSIDETLDTLDELVREGKVLHIGCSNMLAYQVAVALGRSDVLGVTRFATVQPRYNLLFRQFERELFPLCTDEQIAVMPYNPLAGGMLTGKHEADSPAPAGRFTLGDAGPRYRRRYWNPPAFRTVAALQKLADSAGLSLTKLALAWVSAKSTVTAPIIGVSRPDQLKECVDGALTPLEPDLCAEIDALTRLYRLGDMSS